MYLLMEKFTDSRSTLRHGAFLQQENFNEVGIEEPKTYSELLDACQKIKDAGYDPWAHAFGDAVFGDIEMRNYVWTKALAGGDNDILRN